jgi:hypothetical protein
LTYTCQKPGHFHKLIARAGLAYFLKILEIGVNRRSTNG